MRLLHFGLCIVLSLICGVVFLVGLLITNNTTKPSAIAWQRPCVFTAEKHYKTVVHCGDYNQKISTEPVVWALAKSTSVAIACKGLYSHGVWPQIILDCEP